MLEGQSGCVGRGDCNRDPDLDSRRDLRRRLGRVAHTHLDGVLGRVSRGDGVDKRPWCARALPR